MLIVLIHVDFRGRFSIPPMDEIYTDLRPFHYNPAFVSGPASQHVPTTINSGFTSTYNSPPNNTPTLVWPSLGASPPSSTLVWPSTSTSIDTSKHADEDPADHIFDMAGRRWDDSEIRVLIAVWQDSYHKIGKKRNAAIWKEISEKVNKVKICCGHFTCEVLYYSCFFSFIRNCLKAELKT